MVCYCRLQPLLLLERHILQLQQDGAVLKHRHACKERHRQDRHAVTVTISISTEHTAAVCTVTRPHTHTQIGWIAGKQMRKEFPVEPRLKKGAQTGLTAPEVQSATTNYNT